MRSCAKPWATIYIMSARNQKLLNSKELDTILSLWLFHLEETLSTEKPFTQESFSKNNLRVDGKTPSLTLGKVTLPRGKLECRSYMLRPRETNTDCGPWCSAAQKGEWLCRVQAQGKHVRITGFEITRLEGSNTACLKGSIIINFKEIAAELKPLWKAWVRIGLLDRLSLQSLQ